MALSRIWRAGGKVIVQVVEKKANAVIMVEYLVPAFGKLVENKDGGAQAERESQVNIKLVVP